MSNGHVTIDKLCVLNKLACQNNVAFLEGFQAAFPSLLGIYSHGIFRVEQLIL